MAAIMPKMSSELDLAEASASPNTPSSQVRWTRAIALSALLALIVLGLAWELWLAPTGRGTLAIKVVPLLFTVAGVWRYRLYTYRWLSLLVWVYCGEGLVRASSELGMSRSLAIVEVLLCVVLFVACAAQVRLRLAKPSVLPANSP